MAGGTIQGITIELNGDTTGLTTALKGVNSSLKDTQSDLKQVNKLLKMDPGNTELQAQKQRLLADAIAKTKEKLSTLKEAAKQAQDQLNRGEISQQQYDALQREIVRTEQELQRLETQADSAHQALDRIAASGEKWQKTGQAVEKAGKQISKASAAVTAVGVASVKVAADFDSSMSQIQATMGIMTDAESQLNGETVNTMDALRDLAKEMGSTTAFSASQCADAINYLALAGYDTQQIYDTLPTVLNLAAAGNMDLARASDMVTDAMSALGLDTANAETMVDQMAKTASSSNTSVAQLGDALLTLGATGRMVAGGTTEINTALGILANNGIKGAEGGTHLRNVIMSLSSPTDKAAGALKELGVDVFDAEGNMRGLDDILGDLNASMEGMTQEQKTDFLSTIFNKTDMAAVNALLANTGDAWDELEGKISDSGGAAQKMANTQLDNLNGQMTILKSGVEGLAITLGEKLMPYIKKVIDWVQQVTDKLAGMDEKTLDMIVVIGSIIAVLGPALIIIGKLITFVGSVQKAVSLLNLTFLASPVFWIVAGIVALVAAFVILWNKSEAFRGFWIGLWETVKEAAIKAWEAVKTAWAAVGDWFKKRVQDIKNAFKGFVAVGTKIVTDIKQGIANAWSGLTSWFEAIWNRLFGDRHVKVSVDKEDDTGDGSDALGLSYVPFSGYMAQLHKGEAVLNASQAREWRSGNSSGGSLDSSAIIAAINSLADSMQVNVSLQGDARQLFRQIRQENNRVYNATGYNTLGRSY